MRTYLPVSMLFSGILTLSLVGCEPAADDKPPAESGGDTSSGDSYVPPTDADGDGVTAENDCDDNDANLYPGRAEECDGIDNNCNEIADEGLDDADSDGTADCMDLEECDGVDNDGDTEIDEGFSDSDGDGTADCVGTEACDGLDNNGDGRIDEGYDADDDGATQCGSDTAEADCDDDDATVGPDASETAGDLVDNDCDGLVDEGDWAEGDLALTELMINPGVVSDPNGEWFELYNASDRTLILNGIVFSSTVDGDEHQVASDELLYLEPGEFFVFGGNDDPTANGDVAVDYVYDSLRLQNESDELIISADGVEIDSLSWDDGVTIPDPNGASIGVDLGNYDATLNDDPSIWCAATELWTDDPTGDKGSPGTGNEYCSTYDHDGDGYSADDGDCDDGDNTTYPDAWEGTDTADNDCDGDAETAPVAVVTGSSSGYSCDDISLSSSGSYDIEGEALTYTWELTSAPGTSTRSSADIDTTTSANPTFNPDVAGTYVFTLVVNDGGTDSAPASVSVTVDTRLTNTDPVANAGASQTYAATSTCTAISYGTAYSCDDCDSYDFSLSGASSSDADGDVLTYAWSITSGGTYATLSASSGEDVTVTVSGVPATYGTATSDNMEIELVVTDCMGATGATRVNLAYTCTGA